MLMHKLTASTERRAGAAAGEFAIVGPVLDGVVQPLLELLGVRLGEADVWVHGVRCPNQGGVPQLVG
jgi:uncharacterized membrane protein